MHIDQSLRLHGIPVYEEDLPYIQQLLQTIHQAQEPLKTLPNLKENVPMTIVDPELIRHD